MKSKTSSSLACAELWVAGAMTAPVALVRATRVGGAPLRAPHHTCSRFAIVDEWVQAVGGILYFDEAAEVPRVNIEEVLRLASVATVRPRIILRVMPCPCGTKLLEDYHNRCRYNRCSCPARAMRAYWRRVALWRPLIVSSRVLLAKAELKGTA